MERAIECAAPLYEAGNSLSRRAWCRRSCWSRGAARASARAQMGGPARRRGSSLVARPGSSDPAEGGSIKR
jgi:hypothetical protein